VDSVPNKKKSKIKNGKRNKKVHLETGKAVHTTRQIGAKKNKVTKKTRLFEQHQGQETSILAQ